MNLPASNPNNPLNIGFPSLDRTSTDPCTWLLLHPTLVTTPVLPQDVLATAIGDACVFIGLDGDLPPLHRHLQQQKVAAADYMVTGLESADSQTFSLHAMHGHVSRRSIDIPRAVNEVSEPHSNDPDNSGKVNPESYPAFPIISP